MKKLIIGFFISIAVLTGCGVSEYETQAKLLEEQGFTPKVYENEEYVYEKNYGANNLVRVHTDLELEQNVGYEVIISTEKYYTTYKTDAIKKTSSCTLETIEGKEDVDCLALYTFIVEIEPEVAQEVVFLKENLKYEFVTLEGGSSESIHKKVDDKLIATNIVFDWNHQLSALKRQGYIARGLDPATHTYLTYDLTNTGFEEGFLMDNAFWGTKLCYITNGGEECYDMMVDDCACDATAGQILPIGQTRTIPNSIRVPLDANNFYMLFSGYSLNAKPFYYKSETFYR